MRETIFAAYDKDNLIEMSRLLRSLTAVAMMETIHDFAEAYFKNDVADAYLTLNKIMGVRR